jgi:hypothetical protein
MRPPDEGGRSALLGAFLAARIVSNASINLYDRPDCAA